MSRRWLILAGLAGLAVLVPSVPVPYLTGNEYGPVNIPRWIGPTLAGNSFLVVGWLAAWRRPHSRVGLLMMATGVIWDAGALSWAPNALAWSIGWALNNLWAVPLAHVFVSFPSGRLRA